MVCHVSGIKQKYLVDSKYFDSNSSDHNAYNPDVNDNMQMITARYKHVYLSEGALLM